jgi:hypothetical protein
MNFANFRDGIGGEMCRRLGFDIAKCQTWADYTRTAVAYNDSGKDCLVHSARELHAVASHGELALIQACLLAADFAWLADELAGGAAWTLTESTGGRHRAAVVACLARIDGQGRYAVVTDHPNGRARNLLVRSWHESDDDANRASIALVMEYSTPRADGTQLIDQRLSGLAIVPEGLLWEITPGTWGWAKDR